MTTLAPELTLESVLEIWQTTTARLEQTHMILQAEVRRLTDELEEKNRQLAKKNRLADLGQMAGHVAHEVRNHLVPLTLYLSLLRRQMIGSNNSTSPSSRLSGVELLDKVDANLTAMRKMVQDLLNFTANRQPQWTTIRLHPVIGELFEEVQSQCTAQGIALVCDVPTDLHLTCDVEMLRSALRNLFLNSVDALIKGGNLVVCVQEDHQMLRIEVADDGEGISQEGMSRVFDPFYTTKPTGTGLGLSIVERIMECHSGQVHVRRCEPHGTCFSLSFPLQTTGAKRKGTRT
ncbi:MAG: HAMP domain-containing sensor histidine kinase [Pirellulaceae bacterium]|nr:HAMP domain-containing sensor histidine kinase [Pirellulaceae bacterium]